MKYLVLALAIVGLVSTIMTFSTTPRATSAPACDLTSAEIQDAIATAKTVGVSTDYMIGLNCAFKETQRR